MRLERALGLAGQDKQKEVKNLYNNNYGKYIDIYATRAHLESDSGLLFLFTDKTDSNIYLRAQEAPWKVKTRKEAIDAGEIKYWTGRPCSKGHVAQRYVKGGACIDCIADYQKKRNSVSTSKKVVTYVHHSQLLLYLNCRELVTNGTAAERAALQATANMLFAARHAAEETNGE